jgi:hypothetical protein
VRRLSYGVLAAVVLLVGTAVVGVPAASASTSGYCPTGKGVTVVADFTALGGGVEIRCDTGATSSTSGLSALHDAGFSTAGDGTDGTAFVCRINNQPTAKQDPCVHTPPASAYWSYWYAKDGGRWTYSSSGATSRRVIVGGFEGWRFGDGSKSPNATPTRPPAPVQPTYKIGPAASAHASATSATHSTTSSASRTASPTRTKSAGATVTPTTSATATPDGATTSAGPQAGAALPGGDPPSGGSPWPFVGALAAVALIGGGAGVVVVRRRRAGA